VPAEIELVLAAVRVMDCACPVRLESVFETVRELVVPDDNEAEFEPDTLTAVLDCTAMSALVEREADPVESIESVLTPTVAVKEVPAVT